MMGENTGSDTTDPSQVDWSGTGPQTDGTYNIPAVATPVTPNDAGGGPPAQYGSGVLDLFKYGVGVLQQDRTQQRMVDYKKFEATNGGLFQQGQAALFKKSAAGGGVPPILYIFGGLILVVAVLHHRG